MDDGMAVVAVVPQKSTSLGEKKRKQTSFKEKPGVSHYFIARVVWAGWVVH
jgi:hypothetical protein